MSLNPLFSDEEIERGSFTTRNQRSIPFATPRKTMVIVGDGEVSGDFSSLIDAAEIVVRFQSLENYNCGTGLKMTFWVLSSNPVLLNRMIEDPEIRRGNLNLNFRDMLRLPQYIYFPIPTFYPLRSTAKIAEQYQERSLAVNNFVDHFGISDQPHRIIQYPDQFLVDLEPEKWFSRWVCPSNFYFITRQMVALPEYNRYQKILIGFQWKGWEGHPWSNERMYLEKLNKEKIISIME